VRQFGAVHLLEVVQDVPHGHAVRVQADDRVVQAAGHPPGPLGDQHRLETARPVPGHLQAHRPNPGLHRLADRPVARVTRAPPGRVVAPVAQARSQLGLQRPLQHRLDQLAEHRPRAGQPQPPPRPSTVPAAGHPSAPVTAPAPPRRRGVFPVVMRYLSRKPPGSVTVTIPAGPLLACNGHDLCSPPVPAAIPADHAVTLCYSLHTCSDTPTPAVASCGHLGAPGRRISVGCFVGDSVW
jgi:hypothetical protein